MRDIMRRVVPVRFVHRPDFGKGHADRILAIGGQEGIIGENDPACTIVIDDQVGLRVEFTAQGNNLIMRPEERVGQGLLAFGRKVRCNLVPPTGCGKAQRRAAKRRCDQGSERGCRKRCGHGIDRGKDRSRKRAGRQRADRGRHWRFPGRISCRRQ